MTFRPFDPFVLPQAPLANLRRRVEYQERALDQARSDLAAEKARKGLSTEDADDDRDDGKYARWRRQGALDQRERIRAILTSPIAARQPHLAEAYAFKSDDSAAKAIAAVEAADRAVAASSAKSAADLIILAGQRARGEVPALVTAGPKVFVRTTPEEIIAAAKKARSSED